MSKFTERSWQRAFTAVKEQLKLESLLPEQENALREFLEGQNVFVNLPTGYGKSLIFQCLPITAHALLDKPRGSSLLVVISPLQSLMEDQVLFLNNNEVPAIAITDEEDPDFVQQVINGNYIVVYCSPECLLSTATWRSIFSYKTFTEMLMLLRAIDEALCITQWHVSLRFFFHSTFSSLDLPNSDFQSVVSHVYSRSLFDYVVMPQHQHLPRGIFVYLHHFQLLVYIKLLSFRSK